MPIGFDFNCPHEVVCILLSLMANNMQSWCITFYATWATESAQFNAPLNTYQVVSETISVQYSIVITIAKQLAGKRRILMSQKRLVSVSTKRTKHV